MQFGLYALAMLAGLVLTVQVGVNSTLRQMLGSPLVATLASFVTGSIGLAVYLLLTRTQWPSRAEVWSAPAWAWSGGVLGAFYVASTVVVGPRLGAAALLGLIVFGQLSASLIVDHFGWLGFPHHALSLTRVAGALLLLIGVLLIAR